MNEQITEYLHYLNIERGLSANTRKSYERDLEQYLAFLKEQDITSWQQVDRYLVISYLEEMNKQKSSSNDHTDDFGLAKIPSVSSTRTSD